MNTTRHALTAALAALLLSAPATAGVIPVNNPSFESPALNTGTRANTLQDWSDAGTDPLKRQTEFIVGFNNGGNQHLAVESGWQVWQDIPSVIYQPFTIYALRAGVGNRSGWTDAANASRIVLSNSAENFHVWTEFNASTGTPAGTFGQVIHRHNTGASSISIGTQPRIKLESPGPGRSHFDNIRLTSCGTFTGGDAGEGLDLQGDFQYAVNMGTNGAPGQIGDAVFTADTVTGVTLGNASVVDNAWSAPSYGATTNDDRLEQAMRSIRHRGSNGVMTVRLGGLQAGRAYKLQLLFVEQSADRAFDVRVNGATIFDDFRLRDFGADGTPLVITHSFFAAPGATVIELDGGTVADTTLDRNPTLSAFTLERSFFVTTAADSGAGSLRQALTDAAARPGEDVISFNSTVFNGEAADTITLATELAVSNADGVTIDATGIPAGVKIDGGAGTNRHFLLTASGNLTLHGLTLTGGNGGGGSGGAIWSNGRLSLKACTLTGNALSNTSVLGGGAIASLTATSVLLMENCTVAGNSAGFGGAIWANGGNVRLTHCTITQNTGLNGANTGGVVMESGTASFVSCLIAGNFANAGATDVDLGGSGAALTLSGSNLIGINQPSGSYAAQTLPGLPNARGDYIGTLSAPLPPRLGPLARNGGPTQTMMPLPNSPALDRIATSTLTTDQRGVARVLWGKADIGAVEAGTSTCDAWEVREFSRTPATALGTLALAEALVADPAAATVTSTQPVINFADPQTNTTASGFFNGDTPFVSNTAADDNDFVAVARTFIRITTEADYTFGFSSDDGARLRIFGATFISSTRLNAANPANPAHNGDTLSFPGLTGNADTLGVCHLTPGIYPVEFLAWERADGAYAEVFAAPGAKTTLDASFRLLGDLASDGPLGLGAPVVNGWSVDVIRSGATSLNAAISQMTALWCAQRPVTGLRFTTALDVPQRDPMTFELEGTQGTAAAGPWVTLATGNTGLPTARLTAGPVVRFSNPAAYKSYRITFPTVRDRNNPPPGDVASMQIAEVEFLDAAGVDVTVPGNPVIATSGNSPGAEGAARALDNNPNTKYLNYDTENSGFTVTPAATLPVNTVTSSHGLINFTDPQLGGGGHGQTQTPFPGDTAADDNNFALGARTTITVPDDGDYTFCILADDGVRLRIPGSRGWTATGASATTLLDGFQAVECCADVFGHVFLESGTYAVELIFNETAGNAYAGLWAAPGRLTTFDAWTARYFTPVGTNVSGYTGAPVRLATQPGATLPPANDHFANAIPLTGATVSAIGCNAGATLETGEPPTTEDELRNSAWWSWTAPATGPVVVDTFGSSFDTFLTIHTGGTLTALTLMGENDNANDADNSAVGFNATAGTVYRIRVGGFAGTIGSIRLHIGPGPANDSFAAPTALGSPASLYLTGSNQGATAQPGEPRHHGTAHPASGSVWFTWTPPASGDYIIDTDGSELDTVLAVYTGTALNALRLLASDDDGGDISNSSRLILNATAGLTYRIVVDGFSPESRGRFALNITPFPVITAYSVRNGPAGSGTHIFNLRWRSEPGITYQVQSSPNLTTWSRVTVCTASEGTETDLDIEGIPTATGRLYFRVKRE